MIKLLIVDDEAVIRRGLQHSINWEEYGITVIGEARSGSAVLEKFQALRPDIIISDIRMANGDGLMMTRNILKTLPQVRIILLSGYSDKEYMMEAIKLGVKDYLLKPAGTEQIVKTVLKQRDEILLERQREQQNIRMENLISENIETLKVHFLEKLLSGGLSVLRAQENASLFQINLPGPRYSLFTVVPEEKRCWELLQLISCRLERYDPVLVAHKDGVLAAILNVTEDLNQAELQPLAEQIRGMTRPMVMPCYGTACQLEELHKLYAACSETSARSIWYEGPCLTAGKDSSFETLPELKLLGFERNIVQNIRSGNFADLAGEIEELFELLEQVKPADTQFKEFFLNLGRSIQVFSENNELYSRFEDLFSGLYSPGEVKNLLFSITNNDYSRYGPQVRNALNFMTKNCAADLSLVDLAAELYISPSYLTRLLKSKTGRGFHEWLHVIRIGKAKELLEKSDLRHYEIAEQVGYSSYKIFSEYFNKIVGCSARSYRETAGCGSKMSAGEDGRI
ncbi:MAG: response regulator [Treponema sp.]|jgi:two-component system response regulator YesN|nr:response regulator [Treponema sp.]